MDEKLDEKWAKDFCNDPISFLKESRITESYYYPGIKGYFDKKVLIGPDFIAEELKTFNPETPIKEENIEEYVQKGFLPNLTMEDGSPGYMLCSSLRIDLIEKLREKWEYNDLELKYVTDIEQDFIDRGFNILDLDYSDATSMEIVREDIKFRINDAREQKKDTDSFKDKEKLKKQIERWEKELKYLKNKKFFDLPEEVQIVINENAGTICILYESIRTEYILRHHAKALIGFSPGVTFRYGQIRADHPEHNQNYESSPYKYYIEGWMHYYWGEWIPRPDSIDEDTVFFATPEFYIGKDTNDAISIKIRDPQKVDAKFMREIDKFYTKFRSNLDIKKSGWGEKSGRKRHLKERDKELREIYRKLRLQKRNVAADNLMEKAINQIKEHYGNISSERAKRIIYSKEND